MANDRKGSQPGGNGDSVGRGPDEGDATTTAVSAGKAPSGRPGGPVHGDTGPMTDHTAASADAPRPKRFRRHIPHAVARARRRCANGQISATDLLFIELKWTWFRLHPEARRVLPADVAEAFLTEALRATDDAEVA